MEKKMEKMKKEIKTQNRFYLIIAALFLIAQCTNTSGVLTSAYTNPHSAEFVPWVCTWSGYRRGNFCNTTVL